MLHLLKPLQPFIRCSPAPTKAAVCACVCVCVVPAAVPPPPHSSPLMPVVGGSLDSLRCSPSTSYMLLLECSQLLLVLFSSVLYSPSARGPLGQHPYLDAAMQQKELANKSE